MNALYTSLVVSILWPAAVLPADTAAEVGVLSRSDLAFLTPLTDERSALPTEGGVRPPWVVVAIAPKTLVRRHEMSAFEAIWMLPTAGVTDALFSVIDCRNHTLGVQAISHVKVVSGDRLEAREIEQAGAEDIEMTPLTETPWGIAAESYICGL